MADKNSSDSPAMLMLKDGRIVPMIRESIEEGADTPEHLLAWIERTGSHWPKHILDFKRLLCTDSRMKPFWQWIRTVRFNRHDWMRSSTSVSEMIRRATRLPGKPGNMTPKQREAYFEKVRKHAKELMELLSYTCFDNHILSEIPESRLEKPLANALRDWGEDEDDEGHVVAYQVTPEGCYEHHYSYPRNVLTETLRDVVTWTHEDDYWDDGIGLGGSSLPIVQANSEGVAANYFCCMLHNDFSRNGVQIPFPILATVANVALNLPADRQIDEDAARKQVRRFQARVADHKDKHPNGFW